MNLSDIEKIRQQNPIVVNSANFVTPFLVANGLNVIGASPIMTSEVTEASQLVEIASAVVINAGTVQQGQLPLIKALCKAANEHGKPLVLDPVAVGATTFRTELNKGLLEEFHFDLIRGNLGEIACLTDIEWESRGIDSGSGNEDAIQIIKTAAQKYDAVVIASGEIDYISDGKQVSKVLNNVELLPSIVGSGDLLSSMAGAYAAVCDDYYQAAIMATLELVCAGELASNRLEHLNLPGSFYGALMDELANITSSDVENVMKVEEINE